MVSWTLFIQVCILIVLVTICIALVLGVSKGDKW